MLDIFLLIFLVLILVNERLYFVSRRIALTGFQAFAAWCPPPVSETEWGRGYRGGKRKRGS